MDKTNHALNPKLQPPTSTSTTGLANPRLPSPAGKLPATVKDTKPSTAPVAVHCDNRGTLGYSLATLSALLVVIKSVYWIHMHEPIVTWKAIVSKYHVRLLIPLVFSLISWWSARKYTKKKTANNAYSQVLNMLVYMVFGYMWMASIEWIQLLKLGVGRNQRVAKILKQIFGPFCL